MKISLRFYIGLFLLLILILSFFLNKQSSSPLLYPNSQPIIEHALQGIKAKRFDDQGHLLQELKLDACFHYQNEQVSHLLHPNLILYYPNGDRWEVRANKGQSFQQQIHGKLDKLQLSEDVTVAHLNKDKQSWYELKTQNMLFYPLQSTATTDDGVVIWSLAMKIQATGMRANLKNHTIELVKNVKSVYAAK